MLIRHSDVVLLAENEQTLATGFLWVSFPIIIRATVNQA